MNQVDYIRLSLELHLFFDRIMKEHSFFLEVSFTGKDQEYKRKANQFQKMFSNLLEHTIFLANGHVSRDFIASNEMVTNYTREAERKTSSLSGIFLDSDLTQRQEELRSGQVQVSPQLLNGVHSLNRRTLPVIQNLIHFKQEILNDVLTCKMYTTNYPLLIRHIMNEAQMYYDLLNKLENHEGWSNHYLYQQEMFWNQIMMEHAQFIRGLLDPSENSLILTANQYALDYEKILQEYKNNPDTLTSVSLRETLNFKDFKVAGEEGILNCKVKSIIIPLLADHVVREANHFIRILRSANL